MKHVSSCLTHWVGRNCTSDSDRCEILLEKILPSRELLFSYNPIPFSSHYGGLCAKDAWGTKMVCFTDMPLSMSEDHCNKYSRFGIAFHKAPLANCLVCPVAYTLNPMIYEAYSWLFHTALGLKHLTDGAIMKDGLHAGKAFSYDTFMQKLHHFLLWTQDYSSADFPFLFDSLLSTVDQNNYFDDNTAFYYEREWRAVYRPGDGFVWVSVHDGEAYFCFAESSVKYLICPAAFCGATEAAVQGSFPTDSRPAVVAFEDLASGTYDD